MFFKLTSKNAYRDLLKNAKRVAVSEEKDKVAEYQKLYDLLKSRLYENESCLNSSPAFAARCVHWNQNNDIRSIKPVTNMKNPWLQFKREYQNALKQKDAEVRISKALAWFYASRYTEDWVV